MSGEIPELGGIVSADSDQVRDVPVVDRALRDSLIGHGQYLGRLLLLQDAHSRHVEQVLIAEGNNRETQRCIVNNSLNVDSDRRRKVIQDTILNLLDSLIN